MNSKSAETA